MDDLADLVQATQDDLNVDDNSTLYPQAVIKRAINRAKRKAEALYPWSELHDAKKTTTQTDQEYYDYPSNWRTLSVWKLTVTPTGADEERYGEDPDGSPLSFDDYLNWKEDYPDSTDKKWSNQKRRFFIWPIPTVATSTIAVWGIMVSTADLVEDADETIFTDSAPECNEAIELEAVAILKAKGDNEKSAQFKSAEAKQILTTAWAKIVKENAKYEKNMPFFNVEDYYGKGTTEDLR